MEVIDIDKKIDEKMKDSTHSGPIVITIKDSQRIKTRYEISPGYWAAFGIEKRNSYTITQLSPEADEEDDDGEDTVFADTEQTETIHYYAFEKDCCCGLIKLSGDPPDPPVYLNVKPRFPLNISQMLKIVASEGLIRRTDCEIKRDHIPAELWNALWDPDGKSLKGSQLDTFYSCAVSMSKLFELYAGVMVKELFPDWSCFLGLLEEEKGKVALMPASENEYKFYIAGEMIPDIVLEKDGKYIILDAKYKDYERPNRDDRLQILAYADVYDAHVIGHIFPQKGNNPVFVSAQLNTQPGKGNYRQGKDYYYIQLSLDNADTIPADLVDKLQEVIKKAGLD